MDEDLSDPKIMERILDFFNQSTLDPVAPVGGDHSMAVLKEMNDAILETVSIQG